MEQPITEEANISATSQYLEHGANVNTATENGWTPLMLAILQDSPAVVELLLERGADPNLTTQSEENPSRSALAVAISNGRLEAVRALIAHGADINARGPDGLIPVELAQKLARHLFHQEKIAAIALLLEEAKADSGRQPAVLAAG